jgi:NAD+---dinitrogen-reductase ADP-D-ribosyltransferase
MQQFHNFCMVKNMKSDILSAPLPKWAKLPINRCNLPAEIIGSLGFQHDPRPLELDSVKEIHQDLFQKLDLLSNKEDRARQFMDYMSVHFLLEDITRAGATETTKRKKATYLRLLRGWFFDSDGREAAVLKGWVESRFGLSPSYHNARISDKNSAAYIRFMKIRTEGIYSTNALEAQLDLLYSYVQYELALDKQSYTLYRGINRLEEFDILRRDNKEEAVFLFNNLNSFSTERETASAFGDMILQVEVPKEKIMCCPGLFGNQFASEHEYMVLGGLYRTTMSYM